MEYSKGDTTAGSTGQQQQIARIEDYSNVSTSMQNLVQDEQDNLKKR